MEIKLVDLCTNKLNKINLLMNSGEIYGSDSFNFLDLLLFKTKISYGKVYFNDIEITNKNAKQIENDICVIESRNIFFYTSTVKDEIKYEYLMRKLNYKEYYEYIFDKFKLFGVDDSFINKKISSLSDSEKYLFNIFKNLLFVPKIIIFKNIFNSLDRNNKKRLISIINELKERDIIIFVITSDVDILYSLTTKIILFNCEKCISGDTKTIFTDVSNLILNNQKVPTLPLITYEAKNKKNVKLFYHDDVRDIIKDIYKHV